MRVFRDVVEVLETTLSVALGVHAEGEGHGLEAIRLVEDVVAVFLAQAVVGEFAEETEEVAVDLEMRNLEDASGHGVAHYLIGHLDTEVPLCVED